MEASLVKEARLVKAARARIYNLAHTGTASSSQARQLRQEMSPRHEEENPYAMA